MNRGVSLVLRTEARKLTTSPLGRPVAVTHVTQSTCSLGCPWLDSGCYAQSGPEGYVTKRLAASEGVPVVGQSGDSRALSASLEEARQIWAAAAGTLPGGGPGPGTIRGVPLRLHVVGDVAGALGALVVGRAVSGGWKRMGGGDCWTYTHAWESVARWAWGDSVRVLASCETIGGAALAASRGYAVAMVTDMEVGALRASWGPGGGVGVGGPRRGAAFECPQQTGARADCASCMACSRMKGGTILALRPHGPGKRPTRAMRAKLDGYRRSGAEGLSGGPGGAGGVAR